MTRLFDAPHRTFFFAAVVQLLLVSGWWAIALGARALGPPLPPPGGLAPGHVHAFLMIYGFFPLFIFGFLFTAGPRWLDVPPPTRREWGPPAFLAVVAAWALLPALAIGPRAAAAVILLMLAAWGWMLGQFIVLIGRSAARDRLHPIVAGAALGAGLAGLAAMRLWLLTGSESAAHAMEIVGLWGFVVPLFATVSHRMIPFFTANVVPYVTPWRPAWTLAFLAGGSLAHGALAAAGLHAWTWIVDLPVGAIAAFLAWRWGFARSFANRLLAMLHLGFAWLAVAWLLHGLQSGLAAAGVHALGLAPVHALTVGFLASLTLAMVSRVSCGHSGRSLAADRLTWGAFVVVQCAAVTRVTADFFLGAYGPLLVAAAALWLAAFAAWAWRYLPYYWQPRADGKPG